MTDVSTYSATSSMLPGGIPRPVDHTPIETEFQMVLIPTTRIIFMNANVGVTPVTVFVTLHNTTSQMQAFKVKCTANNMFTIKPAHGIIAPNERKSVGVTFKWKDVPKDDLHFISFYHIRINGKTCSAKPREMFEAYKPDGVKRIQCQFRNGSGQPVHPADPKPTTETVLCSVGL